MAYRKQKALKHLPLPIVGHTLNDINTDNLVKLMFQASDGLLSHIRLEHEAILTAQDGSTAVIWATKPGATFDAAAALRFLGPLVGQVVDSAFAHDDGRLEITFASNLSLHVHPDNYEAWHFQQPAPTTQYPYPRRHLSLHGYGGGLIKFS